jgi:hypothetical protein
MPYHRNALRKKSNLDPFNFIGNNPNDVARPEKK